MKMNEENFNINNKISVNLIFTIIMGKRTLNTETDNRVVELVK